MAHAMLGGLWEFPGGGLETGESMAQCIAREIQEELGCTVRVGPRLAVVRHAYSHFSIQLHAHWARIERGRPRAIGCSAYTWVRPEQFADYAFSKADHYILEALRDATPPTF